MREHGVGTEERTHSVCRKGAPGQQEDGHEGACDDAARQGLQVTCAVWSPPEDSTELLVTLSRE